MKCGTFQPLCLRKELMSVHKRGLFEHAESFSIKFLKSSQNKIAFIVRKKMGNAAERNLVKRRFREIMRKLPECDIHIHCLIIAKQEAFGYPFDKLELETRNAFAKIFNIENV